MSTTNGNMKRLKVTDKFGNVYILLPVDTEARTAIDEAKNIEFDEDFFTAEETDTDVKIGLNGTPFGVNADTPLSIEQDTQKGVVFGSKAVFAENIAPAYNSNAVDPYVIGDVVTYQNKVYKCTAQTSGAWDSTKWTETSISQTQKPVSALRNNPLEVDSDTPSGIVLKVNSVYSNNIAPAFSTLLTYVVGDVVTYQNQVYKCTTAIQSPGSWTGSTNWTETSISTASRPISVSQNTPLQVVSDTPAGLVLGSDSVFSSSIATAFSTSEVYSIGELVLYNHRIYKCTTAVQQSGQWTGSTNWTPAKIQDLLYTRDLTNRTAVYNLVTNLLNGDLIPKYTNSNGTEWVLYKRNTTDKEVTFLSPTPDPTEGDNYPPNSTYEGVKYGLDQNDDQTTSPERVAINGGLYNSGSLSIIPSATVGDHYEILNNSFGSIWNVNRNPVLVQIRSSDAFNQSPNVRIHFRTSITTSLNIRFVTETLNIPITIIGDNLFFEGSDYLIEVTTDSIAISRCINVTMGYPMMLYTNPGTGTHTQSGAMMFTLYDYVYNLLATIPDADTGIALRISTSTGIVQHSEFQFYLAATNTAFQSVTVYDNSHVYPINGLPNPIELNKIYHGFVRNGLVTIEVFDPPTPIS